MLAIGIGVLAEAACAIANPVMPSVEAMGYVGVLALLANPACFALLYRHRSDNLNMSSTLMCSPNDLIANVGVLFAAATCYFPVSRWPDIVVGVTIAGLLLYSAFTILRASIRALRATPTVQPAPGPTRIGFRCRRVESHHAAIVGDAASQCETSTAIALKRFRSRSIRPCLITKVPNCGRKYTLCMLNQHCTAMFF